MISLISLKPVEKTRSTQISLLEWCEWVLISDPAYDYMILPPNTGQIAEAKIDHWAGDPPIAWVR
jgi:hypothetical protein